MPSAALDAAVRRARKRRQQLQTVTAAPTSSSHSVTSDAVPSLELESPDTKAAIAADDAVQDIWGEPRTARRQLTARNR